jgi:hypothetical protein
MSACSSVHIGAYLLVVSPVTRTTVDLCEGHGRREGDVFCSVCGRLIAKRYETIRHRADDPYWSDPETGGRLVMAKYMGKDHNVDKWGVTGDGKAQVFCAISNFTGVGGWTLDYSDEGEWSMPDADACRRTMEDKHGTDIAALRALGCAVSVQVGVLSWSW